jgi:hypothetical protein
MTESLGVAVDGPGGSGTVENKATAKGYEG